MGNFKTGLAVGMLFGKRGTTPTPTTKTMTVSEYLDSVKSLLTVYISDTWKICIKYDPLLNRKRNIYANYNYSFVYQQTNYITLWVCFYRNNQIKFAIPTTYDDLNVSYATQYTPKSDGTIGLFCGYEVDPVITGNFTSEFYYDYLFWYGVLRSTFVVNYTFPIVRTVYNSDGTIMFQSTDTHSGSIDLINYTGENVCYMTTTYFDNTDVFMNIQEEYLRAYYKYLFSIATVNDVRE